MNRREWLRNAALLTAGVVAADQLEILERLAPRRLWAGADFAPRWEKGPFETTYGISGGFHVGENIAVYRGDNKRAVCRITAISSPRVAPRTITFEGWPSGVLENDIIVHANGYR